jgi:hypothetical protein
MADQSRRDRVGLGLIGLGSSWEQLYRETLLRLQNRMKIRLIYDPVEARAKSVAGELDADFAGSLRQMLARSTLQGLLVLDPGWLGAGALDLIARCGKPVYLSGTVLRQTSVLRAVLKSTRSSIESQTQLNADELWIPEFGLRFTPSTCRLRELIATRLGPAEHILIECDLSAGTADLAHLVDWCANLVGQMPNRSTIANGQSSAERRIDLEFPPASSSSKRRTASLQQFTESNHSVQFSISCERGNAFLTDRTRIVWQTSTESADESLVNERVETEILIDQFCRRAVGGLNPVGRLSEFLRAIEIVESLLHAGT